MCANRDCNIFINTGCEMCRFQSVYSYYTYLRVTVCYSLVDKKMHVRHVGWDKYFKMLSTVFTENSRKEKKKSQKIGNLRLEKLKVLSLKKILRWEIVSVNSCAVHFFVIFPKSCFFDYVFLDQTVLWVNLFNSAWLIMEEWYVLL